MISRREVVAGGLLGTLAAGTEVSGAETLQETQALRDILKNIEDRLAEIKTSIDQGLRGNSMTYGNVGQVRSTIEKWTRASGKFPEYCEVGITVFYDVYDWHVRQQQQVQITRVAEQRIMIQFMFTQLLVRWESDPNFIGLPYDR